MESKQQRYDINPITVNGIKVSHVVIDQHYQEKHSDHMTDELILKLVQELDGRIELPDTVSGKFSYFVTLVEVDEKQYRLI
ncbi:MAG: hypothetical protein IT289_11560 [Oligoflexia bacterium]|nr:hypothetical protein [Oligoflexia bacterium]